MVIRQPVTAYDFFFEHSGERLGYILDRATYEDPNVPPPWVESLIPTLQPSFRQDDFNYAHVPPQISVVLPTDSWLGGAGIAISDDPTVYSSARGVDASWGYPVLAARQDDIDTWDAADSQPSKFYVDSDGVLWCAAERYLYSFDFSEANPATRRLDAGDGKTITDIVHHNGVHYAALGDNDAYQYSEDDGVTWTASNKGQNFTRFVVRDQNLWGATSDCKVSPTTDGKNSGPGWAALEQIGSSSETLVTLLVAYGDLFVCTTEAVHQYSGTAQSTIYSSPLRNYEANGRALWSVDGSLYTVYGGALARWDSDVRSIEWPTPAMVGNVDAVGTVRAIAESRDSLFIVTRNVAGEHWLWRRGGRNWHVVGELGSSTCEAAIWAFVSGSDNPLLLCGRGDGAISMIQPRPGLTPDTDEGCRFVSTGQITGSLHSAGARLFNKRLTASSAIVRNVGDERPVHIAALVDDEPVSIVQSLYADGATRTVRQTDEINFHSIRSRFTLETDDDSETPALLAHTWEVTPEPPRYRQWQLRARCVGAERPGGAGLWPPEQQKAHLLDARGRGAVFQEGRGGRESSVQLFDVNAWEDTDTGDTVIALTLAETGGETQTIGALPYVQAPPGLPDTGSGGGMTPVAPSEPFGTQLLQRAISGTIEQGGSIAAVGTLLYVLADDPPGTSVEAFLAATGARSADDDPENLTFGSAVQSTRGMAADENFIYVVAWASPASSGGLFRYNRANDAFENPARVGFALDSSTDDIDIANGVIYAIRQGTIRLYSPVTGLQQAGQDITLHSVFGSSIATDGDVVYVAGNIQFVGTGNAEIKCFQLSDGTEVTERHINVPTGFTVESLTWAEGVLWAASWNQDGIIAYSAPSR